MKISTKGRYALRLMVDLAQHTNEGQVSLKDVAKRQNVSVKYLEQIASPLSKAGLIKSTRGPQGGYSLIKPAQKYTSREILEVVEGKISVVDIDETNVSDQEMPMLGFYSGLNKVMIDYLDSYTLMDLVDLHQSHVWDYII